MFRPYSYKQLVVKCDYVLQQVQTLSCCSSLNNKYFFSNYKHILVFFTAALSPNISSTHYWHTSQVIIIYT